MERYCPQCGKLIDKKENKFCSSSCSATFNNSRRTVGGWISPNRNDSNYCIKCGKYCRNSVSKYCRKHWMEYVNENRGRLTKKELTMNHYSSSNKYQLIRNHAKAFMKIYGIKKECKICKYSLHVEVCHIKSIEKFSDDTFISEINSFENLIYLCPNHHWELDNNILKI